MEKAEIIKQLIKKKGYPSNRSFAEDIDIPPSTLQSMLSRGLDKASVGNVIKVCKGLGITTDELEEMASSGDIYKVISDEKFKVKETKSQYFTRRDELDIQKNLEKMIHELKNDNAYAAFDGQTLDDMDEEDKELMIASLENSLRVAKKLAKQKFTPKKYRDQE